MLVDIQYHNKTVRLLIKKACFLFKVLKAAVRKYTNLGYIIILTAVKIVKQKRAYLTI